jgi:hypothetical protein
MDRKLIGKLYTLYIYVCVCVWLRNKQKGTNYETGHEASSRQNVIKEGYRVMEMR